MYLWLTGIKKINENELKAAKEISFLMRRSFLIKGSVYPKVPSIKILIHICQKRFPWQPKVSSTKTTYHFMHVNSFIINASYHTTRHSMCMHYFRLNTDNIKWLVTVRNDDKWYKRQNLYIRQFIRYVNTVGNLQFNTVRLKCVTVQFFVIIHYLLSLSTCVYAEKKSVQTRTCRLMRHSGAAFPIRMHYIYVAHKVRN